MTDHGKILHLYRRAGFGLSPQEWVQLRKMTFKDALDDLMARTLRQAQRGPQVQRKDTEAMFLLHLHRKAFAH